MKSKDLEQIIENFSNDNHRSLLIDGPWGTGKTYQVLNYIKHKKKKSIKVTYISIFGKQSIDEINTELYIKLNPNKNLIKKMSVKGLSIISQSFSPIPGASALIDSLAYSINDIKDKDISGNQIFFL